LQPLRALRWPRGGRRGQAAAGRGSRLGPRRCRARVST
jgi:hypothetical protein